MVIVFLPVNECLFGRFLGLLVMVVRLKILSHPTNQLSGEVAKKFVRLRDLK